MQTFHRNLSVRRVQEDLPLTKDKNISDMFYSAGRKPSSAVAPGFVRGRVVRHAQQAFRNNRSVALSWICQLNQTGLQLPEEEKQMNLPQNKINSVTFSLSALRCLDVNV